MERLKQFKLKDAFYHLALLCLLLSLILTGFVYMVLERAAERFPDGEVIVENGKVVYQEPPPADRRARSLIRALQSAAVFGIPSFGLMTAASLFWRWKLKPPIEALRTGVERIRNQDLDFAIPEISQDELGQVCAAFESMRAELLKTNQTLWRQAEERKRLNAAFAHDLRNPVTVLKGTVRQLCQGTEDPGALDRLETYTLRIERYIQAMSSVQRLEELPVEPRPISLAQLRRELEETAQALAPGLAVSFSGLDRGTVELDHGLFLTVAENLTGNAARFARSRLGVTLTAGERTLTLTILDDGPGFPPELLQGGPKPFGAFSGEAAHFGMGLYTSGLLCKKHGGDLRLCNCPGAMAEARFAVTRPS